MDCNWLASWDWSGFLPTIISVFLGSAITVIFSLLFFSWSQWRDKRAVISGITKEFDYITTRLKQLDIDRDLRLSPIDAPFWRSVISGKSLSLINHEPWFTHVDAVYAKVNEINGWFKKKSEYYLESKGTGDDSEKGRLQEIVRNIETVLKELVGDTSTSGEGEVAATENDSSVLELITVAKSKIEG